MKKNEYAEYLFHQGSNYTSYDYFGAHRTEDGIVFRVWAPSADAVYLTGDFCSWDTSLPMIKNDDGGIWSVLLSASDFGDCSRYKYIIERDGVFRYKSDPHAFYSETLSNTASLFFDIEGYRWSDGNYIAERSGNAAFLHNDIMLPKPINIYEVHLGSWKKSFDGNYLTYSEYAEQLSKYVKEMGYTHIELMPIAEHPFDGSWGYQVCGYYAPTSRYGNPHEFMYFVDKMHSEGIGVILDWVPAHFPKDAHGLYEFDGSPLYEYQGRDRMENRTWGTRCFDVGRTQVQSFLISNALFWFEKYHIDGLRIDAVASMLYLDYDKEPGEWNPNSDGSNINIQAVDFFKKLNSAVDKYFPECLMIAEESTSYADITNKRGLGFGYKWNMGWMNDTLDYLATDPYFRSSKHSKLTFSLMYAFKENYILPISHDEVVHGKRSLLDKVHGDYNQKFGTIRTYLAYMMTHPGKKLLFMGSEYGQFREWDEWGELEWFMLDYQMHSKLRDYVKALNHFYRDTPALWENDCSWDGFAWIYADSSDDNIFAYKRIDKLSRQVIILLNFSARHYEHYPVPVSSGGWYRTLLNSDDDIFGGNNNGPNKAIRAKKNTNNTYEISVDIPPLSAVIISKDIKK
ncbi:MAG: 1,4-alpha-glucan branching protein GlgB [Firmicutes bacterium HGW-Firmicutes-21]|nr:MAG: 1,4-alpha-glucan branching protein GlgB [Firmicutes bacterium HGW-Firmicutes-21]